jgi:hypothetical protein
LRYLPFFFLFSFRISVFPAPPSPLMYKFLASSSYSLSLSLSFCPSLQHSILSPIFSFSFFRLFAVQLVCSAVLSFSGRMGEKAFPFLRSTHHYLPAFVRPPSRRFSTPPLPFLHQLLHPLDSFLPPLSLFFNLQRHPRNQRRRAAFVVRGGKVEEQPVGNERNREGLKRERRCGGLRERGRRGGGGTKDDGRHGRGLAGGKGGKDREEDGGSEGGVGWNGKDEDWTGSRRLRRRRLVGGRSRWRWREVGLGFKFGKFRGDEESAV